MNIISVHSEFIGSSMREALSKAKSVLGENALIIKSEQTDKGIKIYAVKAEEAPKQLPFKDFPVTKDSILVSWHQDDPMQAIKKVVELCERHELGRKFCDRWLENLDLKKDQILLENSLGLKFEEQWLYNLTPKTPVIAVGPHGCGKTTFLGRLAITLKSLKRNFRVVTLDERAGAFEQLSAYVSPLNITVERGYDSLTATEELLLVDTPGVNILEDQSFFFKLSKHTGDFLTLVLPLDLRADLAGEMAAEFKTYNAHYLVGTRFDFKSPLGGFLNAALTNNLVPILFSKGSKITEPMHIFTPEKVLELLEVVPVVVRS